MPVNCDPTSLEQAAACYRCIPEGMQAAVQTYLLYVISGSTLTVNQLIDASRCYRCAQGMHAEIQDYLLCTIANK